jgi:hypothetical protein
LPLAPLALEVDWLELVVLEPDELVDLELDALLDEL